MPEKGRKTKGLVIKKKIKRKRKPKKQIVRPPKLARLCTRCNDTGVAREGSLDVFCHCPLGADKADVILKIMHDYTTRS